MRHVKNGVAIREDDNRDLVYAIRSYVLMMRGKLAKDKIVELRNKVQKVTS